MSDNVISLASKADHAPFFTVKDIMHECHAKAETGEYPKVLVLWLDDRDGTYSTSFNQNVGSVSQMVSLLEIMKHNLITQEMGFR